MLAIVIGETDLPSMFEGTNEALRRLAETIRSVEDKDLVYIWWIARDAVPKADINVILAIHERKILQDVYGEF